MLSNILREVPSFIRAMASVIISGVFALISVSLVQADDISWPFPAIAAIIFGWSVFDYRGES